jgi:magnesium chelatase family protein
VGCQGLRLLLPEAEVKEVRTVCVQHCVAQFDFPARRITVNLAPADLPKESRYDCLSRWAFLAASRADPTTEP